MKRTQIYLTDYERSSIRVLSLKIGISSSEYIRRIIDDHLHTKELDRATHNTGNEESSRKIK